MSPISETTSITLRYPCLADFLSWPRTGVVEGGALGAAGLHAALVLDVDHAVRLVLRAEDAALLALEVEVGHARAPRALAFAVLRGTCRKNGMQAQGSHADSQTLTRKHFYCSAGPLDTWL